MEPRWGSQTLSRVWWALEASPSGHSLQRLDNLCSPLVTPLHTSVAEGDSLHIREREGKTNNLFYDFAGEDCKDSEQELTEWLKENITRGIIRVYQPGSSYYELIKCNVDTTAETIMAKCLTKELHVHYAYKKVRKVRLEERPLLLQHHFLRELGHSNIHRMQLEGLQEELSTLIKFVAGQDKGDRPEDKVQLSYALKVKEVNGCHVPVWNKRFCVLCGSRLFIFASTRPRGKPKLVVDFKGAAMATCRSNKHLFCLRITTQRHTICLAFETRMEQAKWLERAGKIISKHPLEANLAGYSLERVPKYFFLNRNIIALNLAHNAMIESFSHTDDALLGQPRTIGWIEDLPIFHHLVSLSLSDNSLEQFPPSLCNLANLQELDLSCNRIRVLPPEIKLMTRLTTLLLHSNQLSDLPYELNELKQLSTLVIAFNQFFELPKAVKDMPALGIFIASGNHIRVDSVLAKCVDFSGIVEDISRMDKLQHLDVRFNKITDALSSSMLALSNLVRLNVSGNMVTGLDMARLPLLETLDSSDADLTSLIIREGPIKSLTARNNKITRLSIPSTCEQLTSVNISRNKLTSLPESVALLQSLRELYASDNNLTELPSMIFKMEQLEVLTVSRNRLVNLPREVGPTMCSLRKLDIHSNRISSLPPGLLTAFIKLEVLNLSSNFLSALPLLSASTPYRLSEFYAACNLLKDSCLSTISRYRKLKVLHLANNKLCNIPSDFLSSLTDLEYFNVSGNSLFAIPPILGCPNLRSLIIHSNQIHLLPASPLHLFPKLQTLDLSCNQFETFPLLASFPHLKFLDLSGNRSLAVDEDCASTIRSSEVEHCCLEGVLGLETFSTSKSCLIESGLGASHGRWSFGSAAITGIDSEIDCTAQVKSACLPSHAEDGAAFAVIDGGRSPRATETVRNMLETTLMEELAIDEKEREECFMNPDLLQYLSHTFLTLHRKLGEVGKQHGCSAILCHIRRLPNASYVLNVASTGLGEAVLCRGGRAVLLTTPHSPTSNPKEMARIVQASGFISQDNRVNGVCASSRLLGVYHLWPQVIPAPATETVKLTKEDEYVVIATEGLWKFVSYEQIIRETKSISDPTRAAKHLRDLAVAHGCRRDMSVIVVKLNIDRDCPIHSSTNSRWVEMMPDREEVEEEELSVTNIDDALSDRDEDKEEEDGTLDNLQEDIDRMVLNAITPAPTCSQTAPDQPVMQSTNFNNVSLGDDFPSPLVTTPFQLDTTCMARPHILCKQQQQQQRQQQQQQQQRQQQQQQLVGMPAEHEEQMLPKTELQSMRPSRFTDLVEPLKQSQSDPALEGKWRQKSLPYTSDPVNSHLLTLNRALSHLSDDYDSLPKDMGSHHAERQRGGGRGGKHLSYVEDS